MHSRSRLLFSIFLLAATGLAFHGQTVASDVFIEAESFEDAGGWKLDTQFIEEMGSPYLLAHGLGTPVEDATKTFNVEQAGTYKIWVRTKDWTARWGTKQSPGRFQLHIDGKPAEQTFGTEGKQWTWQQGDTIDLDAGEHKITLHDLTGFDGRCDCILLTQDMKLAPPDVSDVLSPWRRKMLGLSETPADKDGYDLVVVGGGYSGMGAALSAARMGCRVALIQNRGVLGGNGSSEVRVWAMGNIRRGKFPRIGEIIEEFCDRASKSPGRYEEFGDDVKEAIVLAESNIDLMLNHHAYAAEMESPEADTPPALLADPKRPQRIESVRVFNTKTGEDLRISGELFVDCTGHGWLGAWAGADLDLTDKGRMGMSNMWRWDEADSVAAFPDTPWALNLNMEDFPYPRDNHGQWFWESGFDKDAIADAEGIRDWNLRAVYGAFNAMKNRDGAADHKNAILTWVAYVGGPRESRRLMGDVVLNQDDIVAKRDFPDGCVPSTWSIDLHYPKKQYAEKFPENPFISIAVHDRRVDRSYGYPVPYRCFYSRNINNLFMAGRCISVTHEALGTVRVMKTCGMMGEVVGKAASICVANHCEPRSVYERYLPELLDLLTLPGKARRETPSSTISIPDDAMELASSTGPMAGLEPRKLPGITIDDRDAEKTGKWTEGTGLKGFVGHGYRYSGSPDATLTFKTKVEKAGQYELRLYNGSHPNRATRAPVSIAIGDGEPIQLLANQRESYEDNLLVLGTYRIDSGQKVAVTVGAKGSGGTVHADALSLVPRDE